MSNVTLVIIIVVAVVIVAALVAFFVSRGRRAQQERQERAREQFGPEYERTVQERGSERQAEKELRKRRERLEEEVQPLSEESRKRYEERWLDVERTFVDDPWASLEEADRVVTDILAERNFPTDSRQEASKGSVSCTRRSSRTSGKPSGSTVTPPARRARRSWKRCAGPSRCIARCTSA